jgi:hypothetical protein
MWLYYWEKYGYEKATQIFKRDYILDKGHVKKLNSHLVNVLDGKLEFLKMVKGIEDGTYKRLKNRFDRLVKQREKDIESKSTDLDLILEVFVKKGLKEAMKLYNKNK